MNSPEHRKNILDAKFDSVGVAIVTSDTTIFVTEVFMQSRTIALRLNRKPSNNLGVDKRAGRKKS